MTGRARRHRREKRRAARRVAARERARAAAVSRRLLGVARYEFFDLHPTSYIVLYADGVTYQVPTYEH